MSLRSWDACGSQYSCALRLARHDLVLHNAHDRVGPPPCRCNQTSLPWCLRRGARRVRRTQAHLEARSCRYACCQTSWEREGERCLLCLACFDTSPTTVVVLKTRRSASMNCTAHESIKGPWHNSTMA